VWIFADSLDGIDGIDLATANFSSDDVSVLLNNGDGTFTIEGYYTVGINPRSVHAVDLDGDSDNDLAVAHRLSNYVTILLNLTIHCVDSDGDGFGDPNHPENTCPNDNCPTVYNPTQDPDACCCVGLRGNVDFDPGNIVDIGDLTALISYLYIPPNPVPDCPQEANIDGDNEGLIDIGDLTALISYLYIPPNPLPASCP
jgi:hypothetical protein